jgi:hypothetical protein
MADYYKLLDSNRDIVTQQFPSLNSLLSITGQSVATTNDVSIFAIGALPGSFINKPDCFGSTTAGISPSGTINSIAKFFFNRYSSQFFNSASGVYTLPASHTANVNVSFAKVIQVGRPTLSHGIWPDSLTCVYTYNGNSITAIDSSLDSFGPNKESLSFGKLTDKTNNDHVLGSIFYDSGIVILHGGTGSVASATVSASVTGLAFRGSITGGLNSSVSASHIIVENLSFRTYNMLARNIYFCQIDNDEFNFTSNPSAQGVDFLQNENNATAYISGVGLYSSSNQLLAVAKISPPLKKTKAKRFVIAVTISL